MGHQAALNGISWAPHSCHHLCTVGDDSQALIWDITSKVRPIEDPILAYNAAAEINQLQWCGLHEDWVAICYDKYLYIYFRLESIYMVREVFVICNICIVFLEVV